MKNRLDIRLYEQGLTESREKAKAMIMAGHVYVNQQKADKAGMMVSEDDRLEIKGNPIPYVSRGGLKLEKALKVFNIDTTDLIALDVGASSGGFTDCLLQNGAKKVYAVDVGYGQLAYKLRIDERVIVFEKTNFRNMTCESIPEKIDIAVMDVSFISIAKLVDNLKNFLKEKATMVFLIKPQFEAQKSMVGKNGVISSAAVHAEIVYKTIHILEEKGYNLKNLDYSPIKGPKGNVEFIAEFSFDKAENISDIKQKVDQCVKKAHEEL